MVFDTSVVVHAVDRRFDRGEQGRRPVDNAMRDSVIAFLTWSVSCKFLGVATHPHLSLSPWSTEIAYSFLASLLSSSGFRMLVVMRRRDSIVPKKTLSQFCQVSAAK